VFGIVIGYLLFEEKEILAPDIDSDVFAPWRNELCCKIE
jgi:hypothetical protein